MTDGTVLLGLVLALAGAAVVLATGQGTPGAVLLGFCTAALMVLGFGAGVLAPLSLFVLGAGGLTRVGMAQKERVRAVEPNRGRRRIANVAAKLGLPAILGLAAYARPEAAREIAVVLTAALAGAFADTAATEVGPLGGGAVYRLRGLGLRRCAHGEAGGVSIAGLATSVAAAALLAGTALAVGLVGLTAGAAAAGAGFVATVLESALGGTRLGGRIGHGGRNVAVSAGAALLAWAALSSGMGEIAGGTR